jgi:DNA-binding response OmpR family regulator
VALILLVDDRHAVLDGMRKFLGEVGHTVITADNAQDAVCRLAEKPPPDLMILDIALNSGPDGRWVLRQLGPSSPPVIIWTGGDETLADFVGTKVKRVLPKAKFPIEDIPAVVADVLAMNGGHESAAGEGKC